MENKVYNNRRIVATGILLLFWLIIVSGIGLSSIIAVAQLNPQGDEGFYLKEFARFERDGLRRAFSDGISHLHVVMVFLFTKVVGNPLLAGRILSIIMLILSMFLGSRIISNLSLGETVSRLAQATLAFLLVFSQAGKMFYFFLSDPLMIALSMLTIFLLQKFGYKRQKQYLIFAGLSAGMMFWVRFFSLLILGGMIAALAVYIIMDDHKIKHALAFILFIFTVVGTALIVQIPSIIDHGKLSFEAKTGSGSWAEMNWVTRWEREGNRSFFTYKRVGWKEVEEYKQKFGQNSIPRGPLEILAKDRKFFVDNFAANLLIRVPFIFLSGIGFLFLLYLDFLRRPLSQIRTGNVFFSMLMLSVCLCITMSLSIVIINYIEHRWMLMALISALMLGSIHLDTPRLERWRIPVVGAQWLFLLVFSLMGFWRVYQVLA